MLLHLAQAYLLAFERPECAGALLSDIQRLAALASPPAEALAALQFDLRVLLEALPCWPASALEAAWAALREGVDRGENCQGQAANWWPLPCCTWH